MERSEESQMRPQVAIFLIQRDESLSLIDLVVANYGNGIARNIKFQVLGTDFFIDPSAKERSIKSFRIFKNGIKTLGPGQKYQAWLLSVIGRVDELQKGRTNIRVSYENADGTKKYSDSYRLDFKSLPEHQLGTPAMYGIQQSLEKISDSLEKIERGSK